MTGVDWAWVVEGEREPEFCIFTGSVAEGEGVREVAAQVIAARYGGGLSERCQPWKEVGRT